MVNFMNKTLNLTETYTHVHKPRIITVYSLLSVPTEKCLHSSHLQYPAL
jgi:hypothetical protein